MKPKSIKSRPSCPVYPRLITTEWNDICRLSQHGGAMAFNRFGGSIAANKFAAVVRHDWDGLQPAAEDTSPATKASCALARSLPLVTAGFHALTSNYGWESFRMEASADWAQWTLNSIKAVMGIVYHGHGARPPPFRMSFLIFHLYYIAQNILSVHCFFFFFFGSRNSLLTFGRLTLIFFFFFKSRCDKNMRKAANLSDPPTLLLSFLQSASCVVEFKEHTASSDFAGHE